LDRLKLTLSIALLLVNPLFTKAQNNSSIAESKSITQTMQEKIFLHLNTTTFITGEKLYFKMYCINPANNSRSLISKIGYIEFIDSNKHVVSKSKIYLEKGIGEGNYFIPTTLNTGNYKIIAYTKWMLNGSSTNFEVMDITIINPFQPKQGANFSNTNVTASKAENNSVTKPNTSTSTTLDQTKTAIETDKKKYSNREKVSLNINQLSQRIGKGNYSVSVRKLVNLPIQKQKSAVEFKESNTITNSNNLATNINMLPEFRGELISGSISTKKTELGINNKIVLLTIPGKSFAVKTVKTNSSGKFIFILDKNPNNTNCIIQVMDDKRNDYSIKLDEFPKTETASLSFSPNLNLTENDSIAIQEESTSNQIENAYYSMKKDSVMADYKTDPFFNTFQKEYVLDNYTRFPTLKETIIEVVTELYFRKNNDSYSIYVRNEHKDLTIYGPPLVLVDGIAIQDVNELFTYNMANVTKISLINQGYVYGPALFGGLISIETKNNDYQTKATGDYILKTEIARPLNKSIYYSPDYSDQTKYERIPDYRYQLLWLPQINLDKTEKPISFYTSDVTGTFEITLEGFTDQGIPISLKDTFEVQ
jgi:anti-sigma28 factor (negative regulator of flagellin synthesis)